MTTLTHSESRKGEKTVETESAAKNEGRIKARRRAMSIWIGRVVLAVAVVGGWQWFTTVVKLFTEGTAFGTIWENLGVTAQEAFFGFLLGTLVGVVLGILLGSNKYLSAVVGPYIRIVNSIPRIVLGSIFIVAFGLGVFPKILLAAVLVFFVVFFNAFQGVREVDQNLVANVRVLGASPYQVAMHVTIPSAMTWIIASLHTAFGFAIIGALVAEVLGAQKGIGLIISQAQGTFDPNTVFACMVIIAVVTLFAESLINLLEHRILKWRPPNRSEAQAI